MTWWQGACWSLMAVLYVLVDSSMPHVHVAVLTAAGIYLWLSTPQAHERSPTNE